MKIKKIFLSASLIALSVATLSSCGSSTTRNTTTPYGTLNSKLNETIATADNDLKMTVGQYYTQLRKNGYSVVKNAMDKQIYSDEITVTTGLFENETRTDFINNLGKDKLSLLEYTDEKGESAAQQDKLFDLTTDSEEANEKYLKLRKNLVKSITQSLSSAIFSTNSAKEIKKLTDKDITKNIKIFIDSMAQEGINITASDILYDFPTDTTYFSKDDNLLIFSKSTFNALKDKIDSYIFDNAKNLAGRKALFKISDEEYIYDEDSENNVKNSNYYFKEKTLLDYYDNHYKTYGEYKAIIIQFNSRKDAMQTIEKLYTNDGIDLSSITTLDEAKNAYLKLYNMYYAYKSVDSIENDAFRYVVNEDKDDLSNLSSDISTLIKSTLDNGEYLTEPRNINNKYVLALHISTNYKYNTGDSTKQAEFSDYTGEEKEKILKSLKEDVISTNASYVSTVEAKRYEDAKIEIYDPFFENSFYNSYSDSYDLITTKVNADTTEIFKLNDFKYTVEDFFKDASKNNSTTILYNYFELAFAKTYYDKLVTANYISSDLESDNKTALEESISSFENNSNSTYPKEVGLETFLLNTYGYTTKDDVLEYYYKATKALSTYKDIKVYDSWRTNSDGEYILADSAKDSFLKNILNTGNKTYSDIFSINLDHMLINIDDDNDGSPDDPDTFLLNKTNEEKEKFENAVINLARAIYLESINSAYENSSLFDTLKYIKKQYEEGNNLKSPYEMNVNGSTITVNNWDDFKKNNNYNLLLTIEQLASTENITETSVSNFVLPFKNYVIDLYKSVSAMDSTEDPYRETKTSSDSYSYKNGKYFLYDTVNKTGSFITNSTDASKITKDTLCKTSFGYHILLLNSYDTKKYLTYKDASEYQKNIELTLRSYTDSDDKTQNVTLNISSVNDIDDATEASFNQFFIYYVQKNNNASTSLDSEIYSLMQKMFDDTISTYTSSNFQNYLIDSKLNIKLTNEANNISADSITAYLTKQKNNIINYDNESKYLSWIDGTLTWDKPEI